MDPLSVTASILAVIGTAGVVGKGLTKIVALRHAPDILLGLKNEVADLYCVVQGVDHLIRQHTETARAIPIANLCRALEKASMTLFGLEDIIENDLSTVRARDGEIKLDRYAWLRSASKVQKMRDQIRADRVDLAAALSLLSSSISLGIDIQMRHMTFTIQTLGEEVGRTGENIVGQIQALAGPPRFGPMAENVQASIHGIENGHHAQALSFFADGKLTSVPLSQNQERLERACDAVQRHRTRNKANTFPTTLKLTRTTCSLDCGCACHRRNRLRSPNVLNTVLGTLFVGYQASPWLAQGCNKMFCQSRSTKIDYAFPRWFLRRAISLTMGYGHPGGLEFSARMMSVRPGDADIFIAVFRGASNHIEKLIHDGKASVFDVDPAGNTALHWALRSMNFEAMELLIRMGSDPFFENTSGAFPYSTAWEKILGEPTKYGEENVALLKDLFSDQSQLSLFHFSELHRACLGLSGRIFQDVLARTQNSVLDLVDVTGRSTLSWAAQRGDVAAVESLLRRGANANKPDKSSRGPLHWSVAANSEECMRLLLQHGAEVNAKDDVGRTALSTVASRQDNPDFIQVLVGFEADIEAEDDEGWTPLHWAAHKNYDSTVTLEQLLDLQADTAAMERRGRTVSQLAILRNCHKALKVLVDRKAFRALGTTSMGSTTIHMATKDGDVETLRILQSADLADIDLEDRDSEGWLAQEYAELRRDKNEEWAALSFHQRDEDPQEWYTAFETLRASITKAKQQSSGDENGEENLTGSRASNEGSCHWEEIEEVDGRDVWEDALETSDESSS